MSVDPIADGTALFTQASPGAGLVYGAVRLSLLCYFVGIILLMLSNRDHRWWRWARWFWTAGFIAFLVHFVSAFHFAHHWSHQHALEVTARRTLETVGVAFGQGIYVNHLFLLIWGADVGWMWGSPRSYQRRPRLISNSVQLFLLFIVFHATVTFGQGAIRWWGLTGLTAIILSGVLIRWIQPSIELAASGKDAL